MFSVFVYIFFYNIEEYKTRMGIQNNLQKMKQINTLFTTIIYIGVIIPLWVLYYLGNVGLKMLKSVLDSIHNLVFPPRVKENDDIKILSCILLTGVLFLTMRYVPKKVWDEINLWNIFIITATVLIFNSQMLCISRKIHIIEPLIMFSLMGYIATSKNNKVWAFVVAIMYMYFYISIKSLICPTTTTKYEEQPKTLRSRIYTKLFGLRIRK